MGLRIEDGPRYPEISISNSKTSPIDNLTGSSNVIYKLSKRLVGEGPNTLAYVLDSERFRYVFIESTARYNYLTPFCILSGNSITVGLKPSESESLRKAGQRAKSKPPSWWAYEDLKVIDLTNTAFKIPPLQSTINYPTYTIICNHDWDNTQERSLNIGLRNLEFFSREISQM